MQENTTEKRDHGDAVETFPSGCIMHPTIGAFGPAKTKVLSLRKARSRMSQRVRSSNGEKGGGQAFRNSFFCGRERFATTRWYPRKKWISEGLTPNPHGQHTAKTPAARAWASARFSATLGFPLLGRCVTLASSKWCELQTTRGTKSWRDKRGGTRCKRHHVQMRIGRRSSYERLDSEAKGRPEDDSHSLVSGCGNRSHG